MYVLQINVPFNKSLINLSQLSHNCNFNESFFVVLVLCNFLNNYKLKFTFVYSQKKWF